MADGAKNPARECYILKIVEHVIFQVLQMCVPVDDPDDFNDLHLDFSNKNHAFSLDNVSYISKDNNLKKFGHQSPVSSESATTARASSIGGEVQGKSGHLYRCDDDDDMNCSPSNENVMFREKKDYSHHLGGYSYDHSPVETTTEL